MSLNIYVALLNLLNISFVSMLVEFDTLLCRVYDKMENVLSEVCKRIFHTSNVKSYKY